MGSRARPVEAALAQRLAAEQTPCRQGQGNGRAVLGQGQHRIMRTGGIEPARGRQPARHRAAVGQYRQQQQPSQRPLQGPWEALEAVFGLDFFKENPVVSALQQLRFSC